MLKTRVYSLGSIVRNYCSCPGRSSWALLTGLFWIHNCSSYPFVMRKLTGHSFDCCSCLPDMGWSWLQSYGNGRFDFHELFLRDSECSLLRYCDMFVCVIMSAKVNSRTADDDPSYTPRTTLPSLVTSL